MKLTNYLILVTFLLGTLNVIGEESPETNILKLPDEIRQKIFSDLPVNDLATIRKTCSKTEKDVDTTYIKGIGNSLLSFSENEQFPEPDFHMTYLQHIQDAITEMCADSINKQGYVFVPQGSILENHLSKTCQIIPLYAFLYEDRDWAHDFYKTLFGKDMPEEKFDLALKLLTACLPISYLYVNKNLQDVAPVYNHFKNRYGIKLVSILKKMHQTQRYFLLGIDTDFKVLENEPHFVVINQSDRQDIDRLSQSLPEHNPHTIIYNADKEVLSFPDAPEDIGKLILTNSDNQCTSIGDFFLSSACNLTSLEVHGLINVISLGDDFLPNCRNLTSLEVHGLINVTLIGDFFLYRCPKLASFDIRELSNVNAIGDFFLSDCDSLTSFDTRGLINVTSIGNLFLYGCRNLISLDTRGLINVTSIGDWFLYGCDKINSSKIQNDIIRHSQILWFQKLYYYARSFKQ